MTGPRNHAEVMQLVADDAKADALALDGRPFDGRTVAEEFGKIYASLLAIAVAVKALHERADGDGT